MGAAAAWKRGSTWQTCKTSLGKRKEIFDAELWGVSGALKVALNTAGNQEAITIFLDSQAAIKKIRKSDGGAGQAVASQIHKRTRQLMDRGHTVEVRWVPGHAGVEGNEVADQAAKQAAEGRGRKAVEWSSIAHVRRKGTEALAAETKLWLQKRIDKRNARHERFYTPPRRKGIDHTLAKASKALTGRFLQLKAGHAVVGTYLYRIKAAEDESCGWCRNPRQSVAHVLLGCRRWRRERDVLRAALAKVNITWPIGPGGRWLADLMGTEKAVEPLLGYLKSTEVGRREGAAEGDRTWGERRDREGEEEA